MVRLPPYCHNATVMATSSAPPPALPLAGVGPRCPSPRPPRRTKVGGPEAVLPPHCFPAAMGRWLLWPPQVSLRPTSSPSPTHPTVSTWGPSPVPAPTPSLPYIQMASATGSSEGSSLCPPPLKESHSNRGHRRGAGGLYSLQKPLGLEKERTGPGSMQPTHPPPHGTGGSQQRGAPQVHAAQFSYSQGSGAKVKGHSL